MTASILVCEYIKHGMTCELGDRGWELVAAAILWVLIVGWGTYRETVSQIREKTVTRSPTAPPDTGRRSSY